MEPEKKILSWIGREKDSDILRFLYEQRLTLFNVRREHEWKILFGGIAFLGAVDTFVVTGHVSLTPNLNWGWVATCVFVFGCLVGYEIDLQIRNTSDRKAMNQLQNMLCDSLNLHSECVVREKESRKVNKQWHNRFGWAFKWQFLFLLIVAATSAYIPWIDVKHDGGTAITIQPAPVNNVIVPTGTGPQAKGNAKKH